MNRKFTPHILPHAGSGPPSGSMYRRLWMLVPLLLSLAAPAPAQDRVITPDAFTAHLRTILDFREQQVAHFDSSSVINAIAVNNKHPLAPGDSRTYCYFDFGDTDKFLTLVRKGTKSVAVDPSYLNGKFGNVRAIYQNVNTMSRIIQRLESRYDGFIILQDDLQPAGSAAATESTVLHEAIHAAAWGYFGKRSDLDADKSEGGDDAPEYISGQFFENQARLLRYEKAAWDELRPLMQQIVAISGSKMSEKEQRRALSNVLRQIHSVAGVYQSRVRAYYQQEYSQNVMGFGWTSVSQLIGLWGGKADWQQLMTDIDANVRFVAMLGQQTESGGGGNDAEVQRFIQFFFQKPCKGQ